MDEAGTSLQKGVTHGGSDLRLLALRARTEKVQQHRALILVFH